MGTREEPAALDPASPRKRPSKSATLTPKRAMVAFSKRCPKLAVATLCVALLLGASRAAIPGRRSLLDESMVNEGMNLIPQMNDTEGNDTAGSMTEATNDTIALEE